nr:putative ubiquitinyl hydrolase [Kaumoebavirus]
MTSICPQPKGFLNVGSICYWNSLIQCLLSSKHFIKAASTVPAIKNLLAQHKQTDLVNAQIDLLRGVMKVRPNFGHGQEDIHEGLAFLLETLPKEVQNLFLLRIEDHVVCRNCRKAVSKVNDINFCYEFYKTDGITTPEDFGSALLKNIEKLDGYTCEKCKMRKCSIIHCMVRAPEILVIIFNKYATKRAQYFPETIELPVKPNPLTYKLVGQAEHSGGQGGGHYWARCLRDDKVYNCNDGSVSNSQFSNTPETYAIFYELIKN